MTLVDETALPGGRELVMNWISRLHGDRPDRFLWEALDDRLRLALAQGWVLGTAGVQNDDLAEDLAAEDCDGPGFERMLEWLIEHWRSGGQHLRVAAPDGREPEPLRPHPTGRLHEEHHRHQGRPNAHRSGPQLTGLRPSPTRRAVVGAVGSGRGA